jgi:hypothetical protein
MLTTGRLENQGSDNEPVKENICSINRKNNFF